MCICAYNICLYEYEYKCTCTNRCVHTNRCVCFHVYVYTCTCMPVCLYMCVCSYVWMFVIFFVCIFVCIVYVCIDVCVKVFACSNVCMFDMCVYICMCECIYMWIYVCFICVCMYLCLHACLLHLYMSPYYISIQLLWIFILRFTFRWITSCQYTSYSLGRKSTPDILNCTRQCEKGKLCGTEYHATLENKTKNITTFYGSSIASISHWSIPLTQSHRE